MVEIVIVQLADIRGMLGPGGSDAILLSEILEIQLKRHALFRNEAAKAVRVLRIAEGGQAHYFALVSVFSEAEELGHHGVKESD